MSSIGPELPPHLAQQRTQRNESRSSSPDDAGPSIGPSVPAHLVKASAPAPTTVTEEEDDDDDDYAPMLPPDLVDRKNASATGPASDRRVAGPSLPPSSMNAETRARDTYRVRAALDDEEEEDDEDVGPMPLPQGVRLQERDAVTEFMEREERRRKNAEEAAKPKALKRDEWMLKPPSSSDLLSNLDPTKMNKPRRFQASSKSSNTASRDTDNTLWTETPAERQQRLADEVAGKRRRVENATERLDESEVLERRKKAKRDEELRRGVDEYTKKNRGETLLKQHAAKEKDEPASGEQDGYKPIWDRDRDMGMGGKLMDEKTRSRIIKDSAGLKDRFGTGKSGGFL